ncbi:MAG: cytochrome c [Verrucomicrobia bacterium]|nr:cytochrome c [Verrucomicrobiota bacterium]
MFLFSKHLVAAVCVLPFTSLIHAQDSLARGQTVYMQVCFACHQPTGLGLPGMFPPLASSDWVAAKKPDRIIRMVLHGFTGPITLNGKPFASPAPLMPPQGAALSDTQIADVLTYVRSSFGNKAGAVTPAEVAAIREAEKARSAMWTEAEILKIPTE